MMAVRTERPARVHEGEDLTTLIREKVLSLNVARNIEEMRSRSHIEEMRSRSQVTTNWKMFPHPYLYSC